MGMIKFSVISYSRIPSHIHLSHFCSLYVSFPLQLSLSNPQQQFSLHFLLLYPSLSPFSPLSFTATVLTFPPTPTVSLSCAYSRTFFATETSHLWNSKHHGTERICFHVWCKNLVWGYAVFGENGLCCHNISNCVNGNYVLKDGIIAGSILAETQCRCIRPAYLWSWWWFVSYIH